MILEGVQSVFTQQSKQAVSASAAVSFWHTLPGLTGTLVPDNLKVERVLLPTWHIGANPAQRSHIANSIQLKSSMEKNFQQVTKLEVRSSSQIGFRLMAKNGHSDMLQTII